MKKVTIFRVCSLAAMIFVSCNGGQDPAVRSSLHSIGFNVSSGVSNMTKSEGPEGRLFDSFVVKGDDDCDFVVDAFVTDYGSLPFEDGTATKGSVVNTTSINSNAQKFVLNAWLGSENRYTAGQPSDGRVYVEADASNFRFINDADVTYSSGEWSTDSEHLWRNDVPTTFWSYYPNELDGGASRTFHWPASDAADDAQDFMTFDYSLGTSSSATDLKDILIAYNYQRTKFDENPHSSTFGQITDGTGVVDIVFYHPLSAVRFDVSGLVRKGLVIKSITLENVIQSGQCIVEGSGTNGVDIDWRIDSDVTTISQSFTATDFTEQSVDVNPSTGVRDANTLQSLASSKIFFLIPQGIKNAGVKVTIEYSHTGDDMVLSKSFVLNHEDAWEEGEYYTYRLSVSGVDLYIDDEVNGDVKSDLVIKNVGADPAYIRAIIVGYWVNSDGEILAPWDPADTSTGTFVWGSGNADWTTGADGFYYHEDIVAPGASTSKLFESYTLLQRPSFLEDSDYLEFSIVAQSVLADTGKASAIAAWGSTAAGYLN